MRSTLLTTLLVVLVLVTGARPPQAEQSTLPQVQEEIWGLPFELPTLA